MAGSAKSGVKAKRKVTPGPKTAPKPTKTAPTPSLEAAADVKQNITISQEAVPIVKNKEMLARVAARAELRPNQARAVYEAVLEELGAALVRGEKLRLPPLGAVKVNRHKDLGSAEVVICKVRRNKTTMGENEIPELEAEEQS